MRDPKPRIRRSPLDWHKDGWFLEFPCTSENGARCITYGSSCSEVKALIRAWYRGGIDELSRLRWGMFVGKHA